MVKVTEMDIEDAGLLDNRDELLRENKVSDLRELYFQKYGKWPARGTQGKYIANRLVMDDAPFDNDYDEDPMGDPRSAPSSAPGSAPASRAASAGPSPRVFTQPSPSGTPRDVSNLSTDQITSILRQKNFDINEFRTAELEAMLNKFFFTFSPGESKQTKMNYLKLATERINYRQVFQTKKDVIDFARTSIHSDTDIANDPAYYRNYFKHLLDLIGYKGNTQLSANKLYDIWREEMAPYLLPNYQQPTLTPRTPTESSEQTPSEVEASARRAAEIERRKEAAGKTPGPQFKMPAARPPLNPQIKTELNPPPQIKDEEPATPVRGRSQSTSESSAEFKTESIQFTERSQSASPSLFSRGASALGRGVLSVGAGAFSLVGRGVSATASAAYNTARNLNTDLQADTGSEGASVSTQQPSQRPAQVFDTLTQSQLLQAQSQLKEAQSELNQAKGKIKSHEAEIKKLNEEIKKTNAPELRKALEGREDELKKLKEEYNKLLEKYQDLDRIFQGKMKEVKELSDENTRKSRQIENLTEELKNELTVKQQLLEETSAKSTRLTQLEKAIKTNEAETAKAKEALKKELDKPKIDPREFENLKKRVAFLAGQKEALDTDIKKALEDIENLKAELVLERDKTRNNELVQEQNNVLQADLNKARGSITTLEQQLGQLQQQRSPLRGLLTGETEKKLREEIAKLTREKSQIETNLKNLQDAEEGYKKVIEDLDQKIAQLNKQTNERLDEKVQEIEGLTEKIKENEELIKLLQQDPKHRLYVQELEADYQKLVDDLTKKIFDLQEDARLKDKSNEETIEMLNNTITNLQKELKAAKQQQVAAAPGAPGGSPDSSPDPSPRSAATSPINFPITPRISPEVEKLRELVDRQKLALEALRGTNETLAAQVSEQGGRLTAANQQAAQLQQDLETTVNQKKELEEQLQLTNDRLTQSIFISDQEREKIRQNQIEYNRLIEEADEYINNLTERLDELNVQNEQLQNQYEKADKRVDLEIARANRLQADLDALTGDQQTIEARIRESNETIGRLEEQLKTEQNKVFVNEKRIRELEGTIQTEQTTVQNLNQENADISRELEQKQREVQRAREQIESQRVEFEAERTALHQVMDADLNLKTKAEARVLALESELAQARQQLLVRPQAPVGPSRPIIQLTNPRIETREVVRTERVEVPGPVREVVRTERVEVPGPIREVERIVFRDRPAAPAALPADNFPGNVMQRNIFTSSTQFAPLPRRSDRRRATGPAPVAASPELVELLDLLNNYINSFLGPRAPDGGLSAAANRANIPGVLAGATWVQIQDALRAQGMRSLNDITSQPDTLNQLMNSTDTQIAISLIRRMKGDGALPLKWRPGEDVEEETILLKNVIQLPEQVKRKKSQDKFTYGTIVPAKGVYQIKRQGLKYIAVGEGKKATFNTERDAQYFISAGGWGRKVYGPRIAQVFGIRPKNLSQAVY
jgi:DNA repair exonuclease SbcCD ATPase subunit